MQLYQLVSNSNKKLNLEGFDNKGHFGDVQPDSFLEVANLALGGSMPNDVINESRLIAMKFMVVPEEGIAVPEGSAEIARDFS